MKQRVFALVGISGAGKTTFLRRLRDHLEFQLLSAGGLILEAAGSQHTRRDDLRFSDIGKNQRLLISGYEAARDVSAERVVLDSHSIVETPSGIEKINPCVFEILGVNGLIHLSAEPEIILKNRASDSERSRPQIDIYEIAELQAMSLSAAREIAEALRVPFCKASANNLILVENFIR